MKFTRCPDTGKLIFWKENAARRAIERAAERGELGPMRYYACQACGRWHLTSRSSTSRAVVDA